MIPDLCIVIPAWNREKLLAECLSSVFANTGFSKEVWVVDDASTDNTKSVAESFGCKIISGPGRCNWRPGAVHWPVFQGWMMTKAKYITYLFSDDLSLPSRYITQLNSFKPEFSAVYADTTIIDGNGKTKRVHTAPLKLNFGGIPTYCESLVIDREKFIKAGGLDWPIHCAYMAEGYIWSACGAGGLVRKADAPGFCFREHANALSSGAVTGSAFDKQQRALTGWGGPEAIDLWTRVIPQYTNLTAIANRING